MILKNNNNIPSLDDCDLITFGRVENLSIGGCTNPSNANYNMHATYDDDSCTDNICPSEVDY